MAAGTGSSSTSSSGGAQQLIDRRLLEAATSGDARSMQTMASNNPSILLGTTPRGNTCLHISSIHGHVGFCKDVLALNQSLLIAVNLYGETPLVAAVTSGHASLASDLLRCCCARKLSEAISKQDMHGCNALHHAIRSGHKDLALELIAAEPALSQVVNKRNESPMFLAVRGSTEIFEKLLEIPESAHSGIFGHNALHGAVRNGRKDIARKIMETRPCLAREENLRERTPMEMAVRRDEIGVLQVLLEHDWSLGYVASKQNGSPLLVAAALQGNVDVARKLLDHCPDSPYCRNDGWTCLHQAVVAGQTEFVEFILKTPQLQRIVNMRDSKGKTALHYAFLECNPKIVASLLLHKYTDFTIYDDTGRIAARGLSRAKDHAKSLNWNEAFMLMFKADPHNATSLRNLHKKAILNVTDKSRMDAKSLTKTYTSNTSLVAILIATITFAAAFTLPGGYSSDVGSEGLPIKSRNLAFQAFLICDTLAMCSSFAVAFICIIARWEDYEFLVYYRSFTRKLMWFAYIATTIAFATGLYTVLEPDLRWLAIWICLLVSLMPIVTKLLGEWPVLKLKYRLGQTVKSDLLDMV